MNNMKTTAVTDIPLLTGLSGTQMEQEEAWDRLDAEVRAHCVPLFKDGVKTVFEGVEYAIIGKPWIYHDRDSHDPALIGNTQFDYYQTTICVRIIDSDGHDYIGYTWCGKQDDYTTMGQLIEESSFPLFNAIGIDGEE